MAALDSAPEKIAGDAAIAQARSALALAEMALAAQAAQEQIGRERELETRLPGEVGR